MQSQAIFSSNRELSNGGSRWRKAICQGHRARFDTSDTISDPSSQLEYYGEQPSTVLYLQALHEFPNYSDSKSTLHMLVRSYSAAVSFFVHGGGCVADADRVAR